MKVWRYLLLAIVTMAGVLSVTGTPRVDAHGTGYPEVRYHPFRLPWTAESSWMVGPGNAPGEGTHSLANGIYWAIDFSANESGQTNSGEPVKAAGGGLLEYVDLGGSSYGKYARVWHPGGYSSLYAHMNNFGAVAGDITQGTWVGDVGTTGNSTGPHLHFEIRGASDIPVDATIGAVTITHLGLEERYTAHLSSNQGAGYIDGRNRNDAFLSRMLSEGSASSRKGKFSLCNAQTYSVYFCNFSVATVVAQDFLGPRVGSTGLHQTFSLVGTPSSGYIVKVRGPIQKAYASKLTTTGVKVASILGRPLGEEGTFFGQPFQGFEHGTILVGSAVPGNPPGYNVAVTDGSGSIILQRVFKEYAGAGDCASVTQNLTVDVIDLQQTAAHAGVDGSQAYDPLYDFSGVGVPGWTNGSVDVIDLQQISLRFGTCGLEL